MTRVGDNLTDVLRAHAENRPDQAAFRFLRENQADGVITYAQLDRRCRALASRLLDRHLEGQRVLLAYPPGLDFIVGFFGCLYAGCTAVPTFMPHRRTLDRFLAIAADAEAGLVLSTAKAAAAHEAMASTVDRFSATFLPLPWLATDELRDEMAARRKLPDSTAESVAMLQYTSGSTSEPKGVMLSHGNLFQNARDIHVAFGMGRETSVFWLPTYHDMGLMGGILEPIFAGVTSIFMAPASFLQHPIAWLAAISKYRATISGGPNFAYDLCVRRITDEQRATLDLSSWSLAFIGAEPLQPETLERFASAFAPCGFKASAFYPCYGLAEATLLVSGAHRGGGATIRAFDDTALGQHRVKSVSQHARRSRGLVSCGEPVGQQRVLIVDPTTRAVSAPDRVGEIWVAGASVGIGYWRKPDATRHSFGAILKDTADGPFLRTGDLGFVYEGQLFVVGRMDDLLIVRGLNHHPQDLEATARKSHPLLNAGFGAAFAVDDEGCQRVVLVQEVVRNEATDLTPVVIAIRDAVLGEQGVALHTIVLVRCGTIPRTSSGKVQRRACRTAFLASELRSLAQHHTTHMAPSPAVAVEGPAQTAVFATVCQQVLALSGAALSDLTPSTRLTGLGLDSLQRVDLAATLEKSFCCRLPDAEFNPAQTLGGLAYAVQKHLDHSQLDALADQIPLERYEFTRFPEYVELKRYEGMLRAVAGDNPYFRVDLGGATSSGITRRAGHELINFCVYDYVGLAQAPEVAAAAKAAIDRYGTSAGASRLVSGEKQVHRDLEQALATFLGTAGSIVFVSGHATNVTTIGHLLSPEDLIVYDALAHNSILQGAQLSGATRRAFAHNDWKALDALLSEVRHRYRRVLIAIEGVYSMDGDYPELPRFVELRKKHKALLLVDEAHSLGTMGPTGRGIGEHWGVARTDVDLWMGTLSKSLNSCGGYIAGSAELVEYLAYTAPGFVYSVGTPPPVAAAALAALGVLQAQPQRVTRLRELSALFLNLAKERGLNTGSACGTPVVPVIVGNSVKSLRLASALFDRGINVQPILHPAVPEHSARLRFFMTTHHSEAQIRFTVNAVAEELARL